MDVQGEQWSYRLNELVARAIDQGVLAQLIAARRLLEGREDTLGYLPGVTLTPRQGSGRTAAETDVLAIMAGRVVIGECKTSSRLSDQEMTRMGTLARLFECSRVLITSTSRFENRDELTQRLEGLCAPALVVVWEQDQLFDVELYPDFHQQTPKDYLEGLPWRLSR